MQTGEFRSFRSTMWTIIEEAQAGNAGAIDAFVRRYRPAVTTFLARQGVKPDIAEDLAQEVFLTLVRNEVLARVRRDGGKFRSFVIAVAKNVLGNHIKRERAGKRGGGATPVSLEGTGEGGLEGRIPSVGEEDETFDRAWILNLVKIGMDRLREESDRRKVPYAEALRLVAEENRDYRVAGERLGRSEGDIRNYVHRARQLLAEYVREAVGGYAFTAKDYEREVACMERLLNHGQHASGR